MDTKRKVILGAICLELAIMGGAFIWGHHSKTAVAKKPDAAQATRPAPAPRASYQVSAFSDQPFTADMTIKGHMSTYHGRMYAGRHALRTDMQMKHGKTASVILRYDKGFAWILMPGNHYIQSAINEQTDLLSAMRDTNAKVKKQDLGPEKVGAYPCEKYKVDVTSRGRQQSGWIWVAKAKKLGGFIVKAEDAKTKESVLLSNIQLGEPTPSLFDLPAGYHKLAEPPPAPKKASPHP